MKIVSTFTKTEFKYIGLAFRKTNIKHIDLDI